MALVGLNGQVRIADIAIRRGRHTQHRLDILVADLLALLQPAIQPRQHAARDVHRVVVAGNGDFVAPRIDGHVQFLFDAGQVAVVRAEQLQRQRIVVEGHLHRHAGILSAPVITPVRLLACPAVTRSRAMVPMARAGSSTCTACI